jgi:hypothetical protein
MYCKEPTSESYYLLLEPLLEHVHVTSYHQIILWDRDRLVHVTSYHQITLWDRDRLVHVTSYHQITLWDRSFSARHLLSQNYSLR